MSVDSDDLSRNVYCLLGIPIDNIDMRTAIDRVEAAADSGAPLLLSTPNVNFLVSAALDATFRKTILSSDLCVPDGLWLVLLGRALGIPIKERVAGADLLEALKSRRTSANPIKVFFFGGSDRAGQQAREAINARMDGLQCVGAYNPGYGSVEEMSGDKALSAVNSSQADFLLVALGAKKGQMWLHKNHARLAVPVRAHLGATINLYAGAIKRAPRLLQTSGLEWAWRIKEEPLLWRRYAYDGLLIALLFSHRAAPLALWAIYLRLRGRLVGERMKLAETASHGARVISIAGALTARNADAIAAALRSATHAHEDLILDLSGARAVDARFAGLLWMLHKTLAERGRKVDIEGAPILIRWLLALYGFKIQPRLRQDNNVPAGGVRVAAAKRTLRTNTSPETISPSL